jgi:hypothetical protein
MLDYLGMNDKFVSLSLSLSLSLVLLLSLSSREAKEGHEPCSSESK